MNSLVDVGHHFIEVELERDQLRNECDQLRDELNRAKGKLRLPLLASLCDFFEL